MSKKRIAVTGGSGMAGHWILKHFKEQGYEVVNLDASRPKEEICRSILTDLTDAGQVITALSPHGTAFRM
jgi:nucleoside-diphosphate-sugar epimerase